MEAKTLNKHGTNQHREGNGRDNHNVLGAGNDRGTNPDYLTARIARDAPDILDRMKAGEHISRRSRRVREKCRNYQF